MDKKEIKRDLILDRIINTANNILDNKTKFGAYFLALFSILVIIVFFTNKSEQDRLSNNAYSSSNQNNYIDDNKELALIGFNNILKESNKSESYNQALIYVLADAIDNNNNILIDSLLQVNMFSTKDKYLNYQYLTLKANYYLNINDLKSAESLFKKSMKFVENNPDLSSRSALYLVDIYLRSSNIDEAQKLINSIIKDDLSFNYINKYERYKYKIDYLTK